MVAGRRAQQMVPSVNPVFTGRLIDLLQSIRWRFEQTPDETVSIADAERIWPIGQARLAVLFEAFVDVGFLQRVADGMYRRRPDPPLT
jgi:hypothetical protein